eukprot:3819193-Rhodomonas_salina.1
MELEASRRHRSKRVSAGQTGGYSQGASSPVQRTSDEGDETAPLRFSQIVETPTSANGWAAWSRSAPSSCAPTGGVAAEKTPERIICNRWRMEQVIGKGSFGQIYLARDINSGEEVAVKVRLFSPPPPLSPPPPPSSPPPPQPASSNFMRAVVRAMRGAEVASVSAAGEQGRQGAAAPARGQHVSPPPPPRPSSLSSSLLSTPHPPHPILTPPYPSFPLPPRSSSPALPSQVPSSQVRRLCFTPSSFLPHSNLTPTSLPLYPDPAHGCPLCDGVTGARAGTGCCRERQGSRPCAACTRTTRTACWSSSLLLSSPSSSSSSPCFCSCLVRVCRVEDDDVVVGGGGGGGGRGGGGGSGSMLLVPPRSRM